MSEDPSTNRKEDSDQDAPTQDQSSEELKEEGYQTPTSEEHKIPAMPWSCPPPAPKKRKRLLLERRINIRKVEAFVEDEELESFFNWFLPNSKAEASPEQPSPPVPEPASEPDQGTSSKKIRSD